MSILISFMAVFAAGFLLVIQSLKANERERENRLIQAYMVSLQSFYNMIQNRIELTRRYRHDLAKHIQTLEVMMQQSGQADLQEYADSLKIQYHQLKQTQYCTDEVVNTVISIKQQQCQEKEIPFEIEVGAADYHLVKDIDMVGILYNLLDSM